MATARRLMALGGACAFVLLLGGSASAQLGKAAQKCIDGYNNKLRLVSQQAGKSARACIKNAGKGKEPAPDNCIVSNPDGKIAAKEAGVTALYPSKCMGTEPIQQGAATGNAAHRNAITDLAHMMFGDPVTGVILPGKDEAKCQDKAIQRATQAFTEKVKGFRKCKKDKLKAGTVTDEATLEAQCMNTPPFGIPDPAGKIAKKVQKLIDDVNANCDPPIVVSGLFALSAACEANTTALGDCLDTQVECQVCLALNEADGTDQNCDLFDDGLGNGSCGLSMHKCNLSTSNCAPASNPACASKLQIHIEALPVPLQFGLSGSLDMGSAGSVAACEVQMINPITIPMIGVVCITPGAPCPNGFRWCGPSPGPPLGVAFQSDGNIGACTSNAACQATCAGTCPGGATALGQCTGYCTGGDQSACTSDAQCLTPPKGGACNGPDPIGANGNICQCNCINPAAHGPSDAGDFLCQLSQHLVVETAAPCDGTDVTVDAGDTCLPVTSQRATGLITDANFNSCGSPPSQVPAAPHLNHQTGVPLACATVDTSTVTGLVGVGAVNFFGSALGDLSVGLKSTCQ